MPLIIDSGSGYVKAGVSGDDSPDYVAPSILARHRTERNRGSMIGYEAQTLFYNPDCEDFEIRLPIQYGVVTNWEYMETIWRHIFFSEFEVDITSEFILITEPVLNPKANRERATQIMFETFNISGFYVARKPVLSLYASGRISGLVLQSGVSVTLALPIYEGYCLPHALMKMNVGGNDISNSLKQSLSDRNVRVNLYEAEQLKEAGCFVAQSEREKILSQRMRIGLGNGRVVALSGRERWQVFENFFKSQGNKAVNTGVAELINSSILKNEINLRKELYSNIVLAGGNTLVEGFAERVRLKMRDEAHKDYKDVIRVVAFPERKYSAWLGASIMTSLGSFNQMWIRRDDYNDFGPQIVHRKCI